MKRYTYISPLPLRACTPGNRADGSNVAEREVRAGDPAAQGRSGRLPARSDLLHGEELGESRQRKHLQNAPPDGAGPAAVRRDQLPAYTARKNRDVPLFGSERRKAAGRTRH